MGLSSALFSGTSGLQAHADAMGVVGNNIANISTVGYKGSRMRFEDALSEEISTSAGVDQVGRGVRIAAVSTDFGQGSFETTTASTDLAIGGDGFFIVSPKGTEENFYTRAGNFRFNADGFLVNPQGYIVQGWEVASGEEATSALSPVASEGATGVNIIGATGDIRLENFQSPPQATSEVSVIANLQSTAEDKNPDIVDPFFAMFKSWDAATDPDAPLDDALFSFQNTLKVYDQSGTSHNLTVYYDPVRDQNVVDASGGNRFWEFMVTVNPNEDNREFWAGTASANLEKRGVLMTGSLSFNAAGELDNMSAYTLNDPTVADPNDLANWTLADFSQAGLPLTTANFLGEAGASVTDLTAGPNAESIEINFGIRNPDLGSGWNDPTANGQADEVGTALANLPGFSDTQRSALATTNYSTSSTTIFQTQNGFTAGSLQSISVDNDGVLSGRFSNGQVLELFALTLAEFNDAAALNREGSNLFSETTDSGPALTGLANTGGKGSLASRTLEQSNVDLATEFVKMITHEKGFQANSKTITTVDMMLNTLIQLKR